jgi:hypothetical protein
VSARAVEGVGVVGTEESDEVVMGAPGLYFLHVLPGVKTMTRRRKNIKRTYGSAGMDVWRYARPHTTVSGGPYEKPSDWTFRAPVPY